MTDNLPAPSATPMLSWGSASLDAVFSQVADFAVAILVSGSPTVHELLRERLWDTVRRHAEAGGLKLAMHGAGAVTSIEREALLSPSVDLHIVDLGDRHVEDTDLAACLGQMPAAAIILTRQAPRTRPDEVDFVITFDGRTAVVEPRSGTRQTLTCQVGGEKGPVAPGHSDRQVAYLGVGESEVASMRALCHDAIGFVPAAKASDSAQLTLVRGTWSDVSSPAYKSAMSKGGQVAFWPTEELRAQDRLSLYEEGVGFVFSVTTPLAEIGAFVCSQLGVNLAKEKLKAASEQHSDAATPLRRNISQTFAATDTAAAIYAPLLGERLRQAARTGVPLSVLVIGTPEGGASGPGFVEAIPWAIEARLRRSDFALIVGTSILLISNELDALRSRVLVRRIQALLSPEARRKVTFRLVTVPIREVDPGVTEGAALWRKLVASLTR